MEKQHIAKGRELMGEFEALTTQAERDYSDAVMRDYSDAVIEGFEDEEERNFEDLDTNQDGFIERREWEGRPAHRLLTSGEW